MLNGICFALFGLGGFVAMVAWIEIRLKFVERHKSDGAGYFPRTHREVWVMLREADRTGRKVLFSGLGLCVVTWLIIFFNTVE